MPCQECNNNLTLPTAGGAKGDTGAAGANGTNGAAVLESLTADVATAGTGSYETLMTYTVDPAAASLPLSANKDGLLIRAVMNTNSATIGAPGSIRLIRFQVGGNNVVNAYALNVPNGYAIISCYLVRESTTVLVPTTYITITDSIGNTVYTREVHNNGITVLTLASNTLAINLQGNSIVAGDLIAKQLTVESYKKV